MRLFPSLAGYWDFESKYTTIAAPLTELMKKGASNKVYWEVDQQNTFDVLKTACTRPHRKSSRPREGLSTEDRRVGRYGSGSVGAW